MTYQKWKRDPKLYDCKRKGVKKELDYHSVYVKEFLEQDDLRDWESFGRCRDLWNFCISTIDDTKIKTVLDCGTKDGQFPQWLVEQGFDAIGIEIADSYVKYAQDKGRPVVKGDVCNLSYEDESFDFIFSHHLLGLVEDYYKGLSEMFRVTKVGGYMVTLNSIPGNPKKHYNYIKSMDTIYEYLKREEMNPHEVVFIGPNALYKQDETEKIIFLKKLDIIKDIKNS